MPSMHREDYEKWVKDHPTVVWCAVTAIVTGIVAALFWNAVLR